MVLQGGAKEVTISEDGVLRLYSRRCVPNVDGLREKILEEAHSSHYSIHLGATKMYHNLRKHYWWRRMKKDTFEWFEPGEAKLYGTDLMKDALEKEKVKLNPRFIGLFEVLRRVGEVAYEIALPPSLSGVHLVFHMSMILRHHADRSHVLDFSTVQLDESLGYKEEPISIVDRQVFQLRSKKISTVKDL
ncbi:uncharacterized protein [Nicotiana sylvestris]|uniref:uncharacterized protein n=1 Tax=Nicotiana sylvestris TaxID=4096 RepID=UPI00388CDAE6